MEFAYEEEGAAEGDDAEGAAAAEEGAEDEGNVGNVVGTDA